MRWLALSVIMLLAACVNSGSDQTFTKRDLIDEAGLTIPSSGGPISVDLITPSPMVIVLGNPDLPDLTHRFDYTTAVPESMLDVLGRAYDLQGTPTTASVAAGIPMIRIELENVQVSGECRGVRCSHGVTVSAQITTVVNGAVERSTVDGFGYQTGNFSFPQRAVVTLHQETAKTAFTMLLNRLMRRISEDLEG